MGFMEDFNIGTYTVTVAESATDASFTLPLAAVRQDHEGQVDLSGQPFAFFAPQTVTREKDAWRFDYQFDETDMAFESAFSWPLVDKLRLAQKLLVFGELGDTDYTTTLDPSNLRLTISGDPLLMYRGIRNVMPPELFDQNVLMGNLKSLLITLFDPKQAYDQLAAGRYEFARGSRLLREISAAQDVDKLSEVLSGLLADTISENARRIKAVSRVKYRVYQQLAVWMTVATVVLLAVVGYWQFNIQPRQTSLSDASTAFLKKDYVGVTKALKTLDEKALPATQRYELAYSYVQQAALSSSQETVVLNNISLSSDENYLNFWIEIGRGELEQALDTAKTTEDNDLILFAITQQMAQIKADPKISGSDRESKLNELQKSYDSYYKKRKTALGESSSSSSAQ
jgi:type VII secretion protein EssB